MVFFTKPGHKRCFSTKPRCSVGLLVSNPVQWWVIGLEPGTVVGYWSQTRYSRCFYFQTRYSRCFYFQTRYSGWFIYPARYSVGGFLPNPVQWWFYHSPVQWWFYHSPVQWRFPRD